MAEQKTYVPKSRAKLVQFQSGGNLMRLSFHAETLAQFIRDNTNDKGYITLCVTERRQPSQYGDTHCVWLDRWQPNMSNPTEHQRTPPQAPRTPPCAAHGVADEDLPLPGSKGVPF